MNSLLHSSTFKNASNGEFAKIKEMISSDSYSSYNRHEQNQNHHQIHRSEHGGQTESSLMRYRSAPSSFFANLLEESECDDFLASVNANTSNNDPEERFFSSHQQQQQQEQKFQSDSNDFLRYESVSSPSMKQEQKEAQFQQLEISPASASMYGNGGSSQHLPTSNSNGVYDHDNILESSSTFRSMNSTRSNLIRQSSSPAGIFYSLNSENGFSSMKDVENTSISSSRMNKHINFSSGSSSAMLLPKIVENGNEMNDSTLRSLKRTRDGDLTTLHRQNGVSGHFTPSLVHHMSLPKTSSEMAIAHEKILRFEQDTIPCKIRAKRGCATHPRSIAERVRRTRISDRMKKLQELFPNMDKQTSTADMLDMAVQHIKDLQKELQTLKDARGKCTCSSKQ